MRPEDPDHRAARLGIWVLASLPVPAAAVFVWRESWWPLVLFVLWTVGAAALYVQSERRKLLGRNVRMLENAKLSAIRTLSHHRHDWMNDLQILYGYIRLNKLDKAAEIVDRIRERMENDSKVSGLGNAELADYLLSFRTISDQMRLEVKVAEGVSLERLPHGSETFAAGLIGLLNAVRFRAAAPSSGENVLRLSIGQTDEALYVELVYEGQWLPGQNLAEKAESLFRGLGQLTVKEGIDAAPGWASWRMRITFPLTA